MFGMPKYIHSDCGSSFTSAAVKEFLHGRGIATSISLAYNAPGNDQTDHYIYGNLFLGFDFSTVAA